MDREYVLGEVPSDVNPRGRRKPAPSLQNKSIRVPDICLDRKWVNSAAHTKKTAERQAELIRLAWQRVGYEVYPQIVIEVRGGRNCYVVKLPDMLNGLPLAAFAEGAKT